MKIFKITDIYGHSLQVRRYADRVGITIDGYPGVILRREDIKRLRKALKAVQPLARKAADDGR